MIRVLLADDHGLVRAGLAGLLDSAPDITVVGEAADGHEAIALAAALAPDVILMDISMPGLDGIAATARLSAEQPAVPVVMLTSFAERKRVLDALHAGARGYLLKDAEPDDLLRGVRAAARGESPLDPKIATHILARMSDPAAQGPPIVQLTERERAVLELIAEGCPNKVIARRLEIAEKTVKNHVSRVFAALGVTDRTQAALWVARQNAGVV